jgi:hypothetical protein
MPQILGFDFSINKPAACFYNHGEYHFYSWPFELSEKLKKIYRDAGVNLIDRIDQKYKNKDSSEKMRWEVENAVYLSELIIWSLPKGGWINNAPVVFEGISYASTGNMAIQLGGYKYILMKALYDEGVPFENMTTYAPITIKKTAGCSEKGKTKKDMIDAFIHTSCPLAQIIFSNPSLFKKKTGTWIEHLDDLVDSYWAVETYLAKN